jgi:hypothetical protein
MVVLILKSLIGNAEWKKDHATPNYLGLQKMLHYLFPSIMVGMRQVLKKITFNNNVYFAKLLILGDLIKTPRHKVFLAECWGFP